MPEAEQVPTPKNPRVPANKRRLGAMLLVLLLLLALGIAVVQGPLLRYVIREAIVRGGALAGFAIRSVEVDASIGRPVTLRNIEISGVGASNVTALFVAEIVVAPSSQLLRSRERFIGRVVLDGVEGILDLRGLPGADEPISESLTAEQEANQFNQILRFLPQNLKFTTGSLELLLEDVRIALEDGTLNLKENESGVLSWEGLAIEGEGWQMTFPASAATSGWKEGVIYLANWQVLPVFHLNTCSLALFRPGVIALDAEAGLFGGWLRGNVRLHTTQEAPPVELTLWAGNLAVAEAVAFVGAGPSAEASGEVDSLRLAFRGDPDDLRSSEATLRMIASQVTWHERGWEDLIVGVRLADGRVNLSEFLLKQEENRIEAQGELLWPTGNDFTNLELLEGNMATKARIEDLSALAALAGEEFAHLSGQLNLKADVKWMRGEASGAMELSGESWEWKNQKLGGAKLRTSVSGEEIIVEELAWKNENDTLDFSGQMRLSEPFVYKGEASLELKNFERYFALLDQEELPEISGGIRLTWQGDGTRHAHSGAFDLSLEQLTVPEFPGGITGNFRGSYSPDNLFSECRLQQDRLELSWNLAAGVGGMYADKVFLRSGRTALLDGEIYLPWNPLVLLQGQEWAAGILQEKNIYVDLRTRRIELKELAGLFGQEVPVNAEFSGQLSTSGPLESPELAGKLGFGRVQTIEKPVQILEGGEFEVQARGGRAEVNGKVLVPRIESVTVEPILLQAEFPFGLAVQQGKVIWTDPLGDLMGKIVLPKLDLSRFASLMPDLQKVQGLLAGDIQLGNSLADPSIEGNITLRNGRLEINRQSSGVTDLNMTVRFDGNSMRFEETGGKIGAGPFRITGGASWQDTSNPTIDLRIAGEQILLLRNRAMRLRTDLDIAVKGGLNGGEISGAVNLVDGRIFQRLEITPLLQGAGPDSGAPLLLPDLAGLVPPPLSSWNLNVTIENKSPFLLVGNVASGSIEPAIRVVGKLGDPRPTGRVLLRNVRAFLPFATVTIPEGIVNFLEDKPRSPELDIRGFSQVLEYDIQMFMEGPLEEKNLILRSDPPLSEEQILLLITAGIAPGATSGAGMGQAVVGQGGLLVLKSLLRNFEPEGVDLDSLINRITVVTAPPAMPGLGTSLHGEFRISDNAAIYSERDGLGFLGGGITYRIRFR